MKKNRQWKKWIPIYILGLPGILYLLINNYMPLYGLLIAFKDYNYSLGVWKSPFVGFQNFEYLFKTKDAWVITRNTIGYNLLFILLNTVIGVALAIFLNEVRKKVSKKIYQTAILLPYLMSMVVVSYLAYIFLGDRTGMINHLLTSLGLPPVKFYMTKTYWPLILTFVNEWRNIGYGTIIFLASIVGISESYYEAAELDGATKWQQIKLITVPLLKPTVIMLVTLSMGNIFRSDFGLFYQVPRNQGMLFSVTNTIDTYVYRALLQSGDISLSSAAAFYQSAVCFITIIIFNNIIKKYSKENALF
ncbi:ABC transporter permease [Anaerobium acetethylicum]|uniref:Putative aldouronate transport system permease protein n=1 Tax=Anaerobium acetethylicum TaxID=1619234 RepID=A0A1D3TTR2_9FIRM|nr:ABC transporter permease subunit [Anaerobium acetethylicum]SCP97402.1 putative aldouronate transport system permease protein [Anaerobium acetethylicum]